MSFLSSLNDRVRGFAAGMSGQELRALLRGEPPTERPNPRYLAHTLSFLLHVRPRTYPWASTWFHHTFRLGFFAVFLFLVEIITGVILMIYYTPTPEAAYQSILRLMSEVPFGELLRDMHRLAGEAMIVVVALHMLRVYLTGSYRQERAFTWLTGVMLLLVTLVLGFSGYLLPWDQLAYWAVTIGTSMVEAVPVFGPQLNLLLRGAPEIGADGLLRFYLLHVIFLPLLGIVILGAHYYRVSRRHGISLPATVEEGNLSPEAKKAARSKVNFIPDVITHEMMLMILGVLVLIVASVYFYDAPLESHANPRQTPLDTEAPWFFLWVQGLLKLGDKTLMGVIIPGLVILLLFAIPYLDWNKSRLLRKRPFAIVGIVVSIIALVVLSYMGTHHYGIEIPAATRIVQDLAPEEGVGPLHGVPYDELVPGIYVTNETVPADLPPALGEVFSQFEQQLNTAAEAGEMVDPQGLLVVEEWQADLKRVTLRMLWVEPQSEDGTAKTAEQLVFIHRDRAG
jgi:ubiquinol-cytochrome c reductase cytochrome b subunit